MVEPTRKSLRQHRHNKIHRRSIVISLLFIIVALSLDWGLIIKNQFPKHRGKVVQNPITAVGNMFNSTSLNERLHTSWKKAIGDSDSNVAVAIYSSKTGETYRYTNAPNHKFHTASTVKVAVLAGILSKDGNNLDSSGRSAAKAMIENSDNDSTTYLINNYLDGTSGLQSVFNQFQMTNTHAEDAWGMTTTTPDDQIKLLNNIFFDSNKLSSSSQEYIQSLMNNVESDQDWGISAGSNSFYIKNGWLQNDDNSKWMINSIGYINGSNDNNYTIAVYTDGNETMADGKHLVERIARATKQTMSRSE